MSHIFLDENKKEIPIDLHPIFDPIKKIYDFFLLGFMFVGQKDFQEAALRTMPWLKESINKYNNEAQIHIQDGSMKGNVKLYWVNMGRLMAMAIFDILEFSQYHNLLKNTNLYKFSRHIRNGAAHDNKFYFEKKLSVPIKWRSHIIKQTLEKQTVFPNFLTASNLIILMHDISMEIRKHEEKVKKRTKKPS